MALLLGWLLSLCCVVPLATATVPPLGHDCLILNYNISGAIAIFSRMNIGTLDVGDFLGKLSLLFSTWCSPWKYWCHHVSLISICSVIIAAIGAIFSATDSVCTLQVCFGNSLTLQQLSWNKPESTISPCTYCWYSTDDLVLKTGPQSGRDTPFVQSCVWWRSCQRCHIRCALQCAPELWS